jgi:hypothetical protein
MADLAERPTETEEPGEFTSHLTAAFREHDELRKLCAAQQKEIEALRQEVERLRRGEKTVVIIGEKRFSLVPEGAQVETFTLTDDFLSAQPTALLSSSPQTKNPLADSFVL